MKIYAITPVPKPRMTQSDKWKKRDCVVRYRTFADLCRIFQVSIPTEGGHITFILPMPNSWSKKKKESMNGKPHKQKPDLSNLLKAIEDAVFPDDSKIWDYAGQTKIWGYEGAIIIE